ncbi:histidine kinase [Halobaculum sp. CBA1158]|uniref:histidine kinase dimerization/phospho-acceptor domain-containing protein n=1 Tax=Halobaculum sp. CBA1158 TaxID=2904243 RepID=UPI001F4035D1|nr:histidine kinase dimerization/phospho-acceptor domain-containing protein [Halobaculum sp. CBA1158]UIO99989.1 histidine kinase [Halobaculum sp. CBA1158]
MALPSAGDERVLKPSGLLIAVVAFLLTRFLVADLIYTTAAPTPRMTVLRTVPLVFGFAVVLYGFNLGISTYGRRYVRTVAGWFAVGCVFFAVTSLVAVTGAMGGPMGSRLGGVVATMVLTGGAAGAVIGTRSATADRYRNRLERQADQVILLDRKLRHEVRNSITAIRGHADLLADGDAPDADRSHAAIRSGIDRIERTIEGLEFLTRSSSETNASLAPVPLGEALASAREAVDGYVTVRGDDVGSVSVRADSDLATLLVELFSLPPASTDDSTTVDVAIDATTVTVAVEAPGSWLSDRETDVLVDGVPEYERNDVDYGAPILHLLAAQYGGGVEVVRDAGRTRVAVRLLRTGEHAPPGNDPGVKPETLRRSLVAGLVAGVAMGAILEATTGSLAVIGALYGTSASLSGWVAHLFHSAVFATVFVAGLSASPASAALGSPRRSIPLGIAYGVALWLVAAGVVMGLWLNSVGIPTELPNLTLPSLLGHVVWGSLVGAFAPLVARNG